MALATRLSSIQRLAFIRHLFWGMLLIGITLSLFSTQATATSFDCKKAASWVEKTVCSNPELSKLDEELAKAYHNAIASLSPEGQKETKQYQRQWLKEISYIKAEYDRYYAKNKEYARYHDKHIVDDLRRAYEKRIEQLQQILIKFPDRIFRNVHVMHLETKKKCHHQIIKREFTYPQIENPRDDNEKFQNTYIYQKASDALNNPIDNECTDIIAECIVSFSNKHLLSFHGEQYWHAHGTPHGYTNRACFSWLLEANRKLQASDLFDDKTGWRTNLVVLVSQKLKEQGVADEVTYEIETSKLKDIVISSEHWVISKDGLGIQFGEYDLGSQAAPLITIDWKTLGPYISKNGHSLIND
jgi:uncharacterized protein